MEKPKVFLKIPKERLGVLIGLDGRVKRNLEEKLSIELQIESETGNVTMILTPTAQDPSTLFRTKEIVNAIGRGFSPENAFRLLEEEETTLIVLDLREILGRNPSDIKRLKGRIIGRKGKTRRLIEELTEANISVYGHTISIIGTPNQAEVARGAIQMLIQGRQHRSVNRFLHQKRRELKKRKIELWETP